MQRTKPPFRADQVGSFLRPAPLKEARARHEKGEITAAQLKAVEDAEIEKLIKQQEQIGLKLATDGEYNRTFWQRDFLLKFTNVVQVPPSSLCVFIPPPACAITARRRCR